MGGGLVAYSKAERNPTPVANSSATSADEATKATPAAATEAATSTKAEAIPTGTKTPNKVAPPTTANAGTPAPSEASKEPVVVTRSYDEGGRQEGIRIEGGYLMGFSVVKNGNTICEDPFFWEATKEIECD